jgi:hypothetical protein
MPICLETDPEATSAPHGGPESDALRKWVLKLAGSVQKVLQKKEVMVRGWISKPQPRTEP